MLRREVHGVMYHESIFLSLSLRNRDNTEIAQRSPVEVSKWGPYLGSSLFSWPVPHGFGVGAGSDRNTAPLSMRAGGSHPGGRRDWRRAS